MTHRPIRVEGDGTRVYADHHRYRPVAEGDRRRAVREPGDPRAVRFHGEWFLPLDLIPDERRCMPATRPDSEAVDHKGGCRCEVCQRPAAQRLWRKARGLRP